MKIRTEHFTTLLFITVILLAGCSGNEQQTLPEHADPFNQAAHGPVLANSREALKAPIVEPSFERLIEQFKKDVAENKGDPELLQRKRKAIAKPDILWEGIGFEVPPTLKYNEIPRPPGYNPTSDKIVFQSPSERGQPIRGVYDPFKHDLELYPFAGKVIYTTKEQETRMDTLYQEWRYAIDANPEAKAEAGMDYYRGLSQILYEGIDTLTAAKHLSQEGDFNRRIGIEYSERAMREDPNSVEAMRLWVKCHPEEEKIAAYQKLLSKFPNAAFAHKDIAYYHFRDENFESALHHMLKATQLDSRIAKTHELLAQCYFKLGKWEQAVAAYQGMDYFVDDPWVWKLDSDLDIAKDEIRKKRRGYSLIEERSIIREGGLDR